jgi:hypothetical protein
MRIATPGASTVDLQLAERGGQVHVAVRTPDSALEASLRQDLNTLVDSLDRSGFHTEAVTPAGTLVALNGAGSSRHAGQDATQQDPSGPDTPGQGSGRQFHSGGSGSGREQRQQQEQRAPDRFWAEMPALASSTSTTQGESIL